MTLEQRLDYLRAYPRPVTVMEVCGTHTASIVKSGIRGLISPNIRLVSGPGCPVCVTPAALIDALAEASLLPGTCVLAFGDLLRVPGGAMSLAEARAAGGSLRVIYSPLEAISLAKARPDTLFILAAVGFETTIPAYAVLLEELLRQSIANVRLAAALRLMPPALGFLAEQNAADGYICPGHVSSVIGREAYLPLYAQSPLPYVIAGFTAEEIIAAIYAIAVQLEQNRPRVLNLYPAAVRDCGNRAALTLMERYFETADGLWRGIGLIPRSALVLRAEYAAFRFCYDDTGVPEESGCRCGEVLLGRAAPPDCALFGSACRPEHPAGACMVSNEGACAIYYSLYDGEGAP